MMYMIYILNDLHEYIYVNVCLIYNFAPKKNEVFCDYSGVMINPTTKSLFKDLTVFVQFT